MALLNNPPEHSIKIFSDAHRPQTSILVANTGATNHMIPDKSAFISYCPCLGQEVCMGNNLFASILGSCTAIISLNGKKTLIWDCLHVPMLHNLLYSLRAHQQRQKGCGFLGIYGMGMFVFFPLFILKVDTAVSCHLSYELLDCLASLSLLNYLQPILTILASMTTAPLLAPAHIEPDDDKLIVPTFASHWPKKPPRPALTNIDLNLIPPLTFSVKLQDLDSEELLWWLYLAESTHLSSNNHVSNMANNTNSTNNTNSPSNTWPQLERMTKEDIIAQLHHPGTTLPPICPSNHPNGSNIKLLWMPEELHWIKECCCFCNYCHIIDASKDGHLINTSEFLISLGL